MFEFEQHPHRNSKNTVLNFFESKQFPEENRKKYLLEHFEF